MRILFFILFIFSSILSAKNPAELFEKANKYYTEGSFDNAIKTYEEILNEGLVSAELYFNLGNAYYKNNNTAYAILNYERAKKISPTDEDILFNLKMANAKTIDKIDQLPTLFIQEWKNNFTHSLSEAQWAKLCILIFFIAVAATSLYFISQKILFKQLSFWGGIFFYIAGIIVFFIAQNSYMAANQNREAIILSSSVTVKGSPDEKGTKLFILHEGTKIKIEGTENEWTEIKLPNGNVGWVPAKTLGII